ncbi:MAG: ABC transporter permease [Actinobacteria bacterium]|jgi:ABC-2 type transport system permease protein|nr:ABC transporter permease [Actinomycetota bacterium]
MKPYFSQAKTEIKLALTQGESLLVTIGIPVIALLGLSITKALPLPRGISSATSFLVPGTMTLAIMATGMVSTSIATGVERSYGVLKRLGTTPLGRSSLLAAKITSILVVEIIQLAVLAIVGLLLGWHPLGNWATFVVAALLATAGFSGLGLLMAGTMKSEVIIGAANGIYLVLLFIGGMIIPLSSLPSALETFARLLPAAALSDALYHSMGAGGGVPVWAWLNLVVWAIFAPLLAAKTFRWEQ